MTLKEQIAQQIQQVQSEISQLQSQLTALEAELSSLQHIYPHLDVLGHYSVETAPVVQENTVVEPEPEPVVETEPHECPTEPVLVTRPTVYLSNNGPFK